MYKIWLTFVENNREHHPVVVGQRKRIKKCATNSVENIWGDRSNSSWKLFEYIEWTTVTTYCLCDIVSSSQSLYNYALSVWWIWQKIQTLRSIFGRGTLSRFWLVLVLDGWVFLCQLKRQVISLSDERQFDSGWPIQMTFLALETKPHGSTTKTSRSSWVGLCIKMLSEE